MFGVLCGSLFFGQCSDWFGRKQTMLITHAGMFVFDLLASFTTSLQMFNIVHFITMIFVGGHNTIMHVFLLENMPKRIRVLIMTALSYSPNYVIFAGIAYVTREWRLLLSVLGLLNIPAFIGLLWVFKQFYYKFYVNLCKLYRFAFESPRWLIQKARLDSARHILTRIETINGTATDYPPRILGDLIQNEVESNEKEAKEEVLLLPPILHGEDEHVHRNDLIRIVRSLVS